MSYQSPAPEIEEGFWSSAIPSPAEPMAPWESFVLFQGPTGCSPSFRVHTSSLAAGQVAHPLHSHEQEEVMVILEGSVDLGMGVGGQPLEVPGLGAGSLVFQSSGIAHTFRGAGPGRARYVVFRWVGGARRAAASLPFFIQRGLPAGGRLRGRPLVQVAPRHLDQLEVRFQALAPGAGLDQGPGDLALVLLAGSLACHGRALEAPAVAYLPSGCPREVRNAAAAPAACYAIGLRG
jgi:hypothetical protein